MVSIFRSLLSIYPKNRHTSVSTLKQYWYNHPNQLVTECIDTASSISSLLKTCFLVFPYMGFLYILVYIYYQSNFSDFVPYPDTFLSLMKDNLKQWKDL